MDNFSLLQKRLYKTPVVTFGAGINRQGETRTVNYNGMLIPSFLFHHDGDWQNYRQFLWENKIGSVFELENGRLVNIRKREDRFLPYVDV